MSHSTRSKPASQSSPETGDAPERSAQPVEIELESARGELAGWAAFQVILGALLASKLGTVGVWVGILLIVRGAFRAYELAQTFRHPPGTVVVSDERVVLPRGLNMGKPVEVAPSEVTAVYFLRHSVPWNRSAPVLIVELGARAMAFPRDWFASEADQRHVIHALLGRIGPPGSEPPSESDDSSKEAESGAEREAVARAVVVSPRSSAVAVLDEAQKLVWLQLGVGLALLVAGILGAVTSTSGGPGGDYALYVAPIVVGFILCWRALTRW